MDSINRFFTMAAGLVITASLIFVAFRLADEGKRLGEHAVSSLAKVNAEWKEDEITRYEGLTVKGSDVINFMRKNLSMNLQDGSEQLVVITETDVVTVHKNMDSMEDVMNFSHASYINPTSEFVGKVNRNENGVIVSVRFTQV